MSETKKAQFQEFLNMMKGGRKELGDNIVVEEKKKEKKVKKETKEETKEATSAPR